MATVQKQQKIYMVTGKGGVGKSVVAAALAKQLARSGKRTLLVELGDVSTLQFVFKKDIGYDPVDLEENLSVALWNGEASLREYVQYLLKVRTLANLFFDNKIMRTFIRAAPALKELAILGKITSGVRGWGPPLEYDCIVVDAYATGHFMALLKAPIGMGELIATGPMGDQSRAMHQVLSDPATTTYLIVTLLEELPVSESLELNDELKKWMGLSAQIVANKHFELPFSMPEKETLKSRVSVGSAAEHFFNHVLALEERCRRALARLSKVDAGRLRVPLILAAHTAEVIDEVADKVPLT